MSFKTRSYTIPKGSSPPGSHGFILCLVFMRCMKMLCLRHHDKPRAGMGRSGRGIQTPLGGTTRTLHSAKGC
eukprot:4408768-Amphidinium_carterae.1